MRNEQQKEVDWARELSPEVEGLSFLYKLPRNPDVVGRMTTAAVYKLLTGQEIEDRSRNNFLEGNSLIQSEEDERRVHGLYDLLDELYGNDGQIEFEEAEKQGNRARRAVEQNLPHIIIADYDMWKMRQLHDRVIIEPDKADGQVVTMHTTLPEVASVKGKPDVILSRNLDASGIRKRHQSLHSFIGNAAQKLGFTGKEVMEDMLEERQNMFFIDSMNEAGHTANDAKRGAINAAIDEEIPQPTAESQYELLNQTEREIAQQPRSENLSANLKKTLKHGDTEAELHLNIRTKGNLRYNPETKTLEGEITPDGKEVVSARVCPKITASTTDEDLLEIRREASEIADELGFPKPLRWF